MTAKMATGSASGTQKRIFAGCWASLSRAASSTKHPNVSTRLCGLTSATGTLTWAPAWKRGSCLRARSTPHRRCAAPRCRSGAVVGTRWVVMLVTAGRPMRSCLAGSGFRTISQETSLIMGRTAPRGLPARHRGSAGGTHARSSAGLLPTQPRAPTATTKRGARRRRQSASGI